MIGLRDRSRRNWFPVDPADLFASAHKLGATQDEIEELLRRTGLSQKDPAPATRSEAR